MTVLPDDDYVADPAGLHDLPSGLRTPCCVHCKAEFGSRVAMACHRRHPTSIGTPCEDPKNAKSISYTGRASVLSSIVREHDTLGTTKYIQMHGFMYCLYFLFLK